MFARTVPRWLGTTAWPRGPVDAAGLRPIKLRQTAATTPAIAHTPPPIHNAVATPALDAIAPVISPPIGAGPSKTTTYTLITRPRRRSGAPSWSVMFPVTP